MMLVVGVCFTISASIKPSTVENPIWYQLQSGNEFDSGEPHLVSAPEWQRISWMV